MSDAVVTIDAYDERFTLPRSEWRCLNVASFRPDLYEWLQAYTPEAKVAHRHKRVRSHNGWGNRGGWMDRATTIDFIFPDAGAEMVFRMAWNYFK